LGELARHADEYREHGVRVVPILAQRAEPVRRYVQETGLPFNILVDERREVAKAYGVWQRAGLASWNIARPALFLIDRSFRIRYSFIGDRQDEYPEHAEILAAVRSLDPQR
jgi:peroxiredoxin